MRHTKSRRARRRKPHILLLLLAVPIICRTPGTGHTIQETPPTVYTSFIHTIRTYHTNSYQTHTTKFIYIYIYIYIQHARGAYTQRKRTHTSTHTHTIQIILYTQIHIYIIIIYTYTNMHIYIIVIHVHVNAHISILLYIIILLTKTTATQNEVALSYHRLRGVYFPAVVFVSTIVCEVLTSADIIANLVVGSDNGLTNGAGKLEVLILFMMEVM